MPIDRDLWLDPFAEFPRWPCPSCQFGRLTAPNRDSSDFIFDIIDWEGEYPREHFSMFLKCNNTHCNKTVSATGVITYFEAASINALSDKKISLVSTYKIDHLMPAPPIFSFPKKCPTAVAKHLELAFAHMWFDHGACANRMRAAVEAVLDDHGTPKTRMTSGKKGGARKRIRMSLHERILSFRAKDEDAANYLEAIKWLGNTGSHHGLDKQDRDELLDGFELLEHVIDRLYERREERRLYT